MSWLEHFVRVHSVLKHAGMFPPVADIQEAVALVIRYQIKSEIIGSWLYCYPNPLIGYQLESIGFWFSYKHAAYIYNGYPKQGMADDESLEEIKARLGCQNVQGVMYGSR